MSGVRDKSAVGVAQWQLAGEALAEVRREELRHLTDAEALTAANTLLDLIGLLPPAHATTGLVEQQRLFAFARARA